MKLAIYFLVGLPVLFVTYTVCEASSASQLTELTYIYVKNVLPDDQSVISSTVTRSKLSCASTCQRESVTKGCTIAVYNRTTKHCTLTNGTFGSLIYTDDNDTLTLYPQRECLQGNLPVAENGVYSYVQREALGAYSLYCDAGYELSLLNEINFIACDVNGVWIQNNLTCLPREETTYAEGRSFLTAFMPNYGMAAVSLHLYIIPSDGNTRTQYSTVTVTAPYASFKQTMPLTDFLKVEIPTGVINETTDIGIPNVVSVSSDKPVTVFAMNSSPYSSGGILVLPSQSLSASYVVTASPYDAVRNRLVIIPTAQDKTTEVRVTFPDGANIVVDVKYGDTYQIQRKFLTGTIIESDDDIAVLAGEWCANLPDPGNYSCDHIVEQMPPTEALDTLYILAQTSPRTTYIVTIAAVVNNTLVTLKDATNQIINVEVMNPGDTVSRTFDTLPLMSVTANNPVLVTQYGVSASVDNADAGDPSMFIVPGVNRFMDKYRFFVPEGYDLNKVIIIYDMNATVDPQNGLLHNGIPSYIAEMTLVQVDLQVFGICYLDLPYGVHQLENSVKFGAILYGQKRLNEYAWNLGMHLGKR